MWIATIALCMTIGGKVECSKQYIAFSDSALGCHNLAIDAASNLVAKLDENSGNGYAGFAVSCWFSGSDGAG